ncbi:FecR domain-containing protein [uncultured Draconibacterium sp.]|uniref:FecR domain-containing protein n=1 Tax=uncultured Draconibacterium sp. TaxID=1573823 RepID=UPI002AA87CEF|nr:FecR domain-containing protein [uncultured Draconibacterium sp.]
MTKKKYTNYTFEELIHDQEFVEAIQNITTEKEWRKFLELNEDSKENILKAKKFIALFWINNEQLASDKKHELWLKIRDFNKTYATRNKTIQFKRLIRIAATVLIVISFSSILYLSLYNKRNQYAFSETNNRMNTENTVLTLTSGERIEINKEEAKIAVLDDETVQIDNDTIQKNELVAASSENEFILNELVVPFGKKTTLVLNDGTKVWLNAGTKFAFPQKFIGKKRKVYIDGEGYFEVAKDKEQPFIVSSEKINVEVLGTKFNMNSYSEDEQSETVLLEGSVVVWSDSKLIRDKITMSPNQKVTYDLTDKTLNVVSEPDAGDYIAWIDGWYKFSNESLEQVLIKVGRFYNITFHYDNVEIQKALPISGKLYLKESFDEVMLTLSKVANIEFEIKGNNVIIN